MKLFCRSRKFIALKCCNNGCENLGEPTVALSLVDSDSCGRRGDPRAGVSSALLHLPRTWFVQSRSSAFAPAQSAFISARGPMKMTTNGCGHTSRRGATQVQRKLDLQHDIVEQRMASYAGTVKEWRRDSSGQGRFPSNRDHGCAVCYRSSLRTQ